MKKTKKQWALDAYSEANGLAKQVIIYLFELEKQRELTKEEKKMYDQAKKVRFDVNDAYLLVKGSYLHKMPES